MKIFFFIQIVKQQGGFDVCSSANKWSQVARQMNFNDPQTGRVLKQHYERLLLSFDVHESGIYAEETLTNETNGAGVTKKRGTTRTLKTNESDPVC